MKCEKIQEFILTDYLDGQLTEDQKNTIESHLAQCSRCREFAETARKVAVEPFAAAKPIAPPEHVWHKIKETIFDEQPDAIGMRKRILQGWESFLGVPHPVMVMVFVLILLLVSVTLGAFVNTQVVEKKRTKEQVEYLAYLTQPLADTAAKEDQGLGTLLEEYFL